MFLAGGRGRPKRTQVYCSNACHMRVRPPVHTGSHAPRPKKYRDTLHDEAWLRARYIDERLSTTEIGALLGCPRATVKWALAKWGIGARSGSEARNLLYDRRGRKTVTQEDFIAAYGGKCACCGETERIFLTIDHIGGGGAEHRRQFGGQNKKVLQDIKAQGWPQEGYRC